MVRTGYRVGIGWALVAAGAFAFAQTEAEFTDKGDNMKVSGISGWTSEVVSKGVVRFTAIGKAVKGTWKKQKLTVLTSRIDGQAVAGTRGSMELQSAMMSGGVKATIERASSNKLSKEAQTVVITGRQAKYVAAANRLDVYGVVKIVDTDPGAKRRMAMGGTTASVVLCRQDANHSGDAVASSSLRGPIPFELDNSAVDENGVTHKLKLEGTAEGIDYGRAKGGDRQRNRIVALAGEVHLTETEWAEKKPGSEVEGSKVTRVFDGTSATLTLGTDPDRPNQETVTSAKVEGPVTFSMEAYELEAVEQPRKATDKSTDKKTVEKRWAPYSLKGRADALNYRLLDPAELAGAEGASSVLTLTGNVQIEGSIHNVKLRGIDEAVIWLDKAGDVVRLKATGAPGVVKVKPPKVGSLPLDGGGKVGVIARLPALTPVRREDLRREASPRARATSGPWHGLFPNPMISSREGAAT